MIVDVVVWGLECGVVYFGSTCGSTTSLPTIYSLPLYFSPTARNRTHTLSLSPSLSLSVSLPCFYIQSEFHHGPPQKRQLLARCEKILHPAPPTPRRQRELVDFLQTPIQGCVLGSGPLRSETMLREAIDEDWVDARAFNRPAVSRRDCLVSFFLPPSCAAQMDSELRYYCYSPNAKKIISPADRELLEQHGAAVVECSWVRVQEVPWSRIGGKCERLCTSPPSIIYTYVPSCLQYNLLQYPTSSPQTQ